MQVNEPLVLGQVALLLQSAAPLVHSLTSEQVKPFPEYPLLHAHVYVPGVFVQVAFGSQAAVFAAHSSVSLQVEGAP